MLLRIVFNIILLTLCFNSYAVDCSKHPVYCQIKNNKPNIDKDYAMKLSNIIYKMHKKYHIPTRIFTAILMQESGYKLEAKGCRTGIPHDLPKQHPVTVCSDFGITQIHWKTAKLWGFDIDLLTNDLEYSIESGAKVLHYFMERYEAKENEWYLRYNCGTKPSIKRDTCQVYKKLVERYL